MTFTHTIEYLESDQILLIKTRGPLIPSGFDDILSDTLAHLSKHTVKGIIVDHSSSTAKDIFYDDMLHIAESNKTINPFMEDARLAVIVDSQHGYGLGRMWYSIVQHDVTYEVAVFFEYAKAVEWIKAL